MARRESRLGRPRVHRRIRRGEPVLLPRGAPVARGRVRVSGHIRPRVRHILLLPGMLRRLPPRGGRVLRAQSLPHAAADREILGQVPDS